MSDVLVFLSEMYLFQNSLLAWSAALLIMLFSLLVLSGARVFLPRRLAAKAEKSDNKWDDLAMSLVSKTRMPFIFLVSVYFGALTLALPARIVELIRIVIIIALLIQVGFWSTHVVSFLVAKRRQEQLADEAGSPTTLHAVEMIGKWVIWILIVLLALDNIPTIQVTTLIASLGIGGIAIGLAVQNILGDLFASLSIALDKPFVIGDFVSVGDYSGTVEYVGIKSTRMRSISGEQVVFSNSDLMGSRIRNYKRMARRRIAFTIGVTYQTPSEKLSAIPQMVREIIDAQENAAFDRAHFKEFGPSSLDFEVVYFMEVPDYLVYMDVQQSINLALYKCFKREGIEFAYPTQTLFIDKNTSDELVRSNPI